LQLGEEGNDASGEILELATQVCGDLRIEVRPGGVLKLYHSTIRTVSQILSYNACSQGYALFVDGTLIMDQSRISYISGSTSQCLRGRAQATIRQSTFSYCDGSALSCVNVDGAKITIEDCVIRGSGNWGLVVRGLGGEPVEVRDSVLDAQLGAVFITGESGAARLVDCAFDPAKIVFNRSSGQVEVAWARRFRVVDAETDQPRADVVVRVRGADGRTLEARTDADGQVELVLTEWTARPGEVMQVDGVNTSTPYRVEVVGEEGMVLAVVDELVVRGKADEEFIAIKVP
jgi:hypothetical protein